MKILVKIWKDLTQVSDGNYFVPLDVHSISEKLEILARPPKDTAGKQATLMRMGFPINEGKNKYVCPQCRYRVTGESKCFIVLIFDFFSKHYPQPAQFVDCH